MNRAVLQRRGRVAVMRLTGEPVATIAEALGVSTSTVYRDLTVLSHALAGDGSGPASEAVEAELHGGVPRALAAAARRLAVVVDDPGTTPSELQAVSRELRITMGQIRAVAGGREEDGIDELSAARERRRSGMG